MKKPGRGQVKLSTYFCTLCGLTGYIVFSGVRRARGVQGLRVIIQSDRPPQYVDDRVEAFLNHMEVSPSIQVVREG